jgi:hypothetical protein
MRQENWSFTKRVSIYLKLDRAIYSGNGIYSLSPGTLPKRRACQSRFAISIRALELDTKFHQM